MSDDAARALTDELQALTEHLPFDVWVRDQHDRCIYANPVCLQHWPGLVGKTPEHSAPSPDVLAVWTENNRRAREGEVVVGDVTYRYPDGRHAIVRNIVAPVRRDGRVVGTVGVNLDITAEREAEQRAHEREQIIQAVFDATQAIMGVRQILGDDDLLHIANNRMACRLFGIEPDDPRRKDSEFGVSRDFRVRSINLAREALRSRSPVGFEQSYEVPGMGMRTFSGRIAPIEGTDSERFLYFAEDVTETRTMRASLLHAERLASLGTLAAGVAHEIKNPATAVLLTLQTLRRRIHDSVELSDRARSTLLSTLSDAEAGAAHIAKMVMDLGHLARPEDERLELVALDEVLRSAASLARSSVQRTAQLELELAPVWTYASAVRLAQVVLNLLVNASNARVRDVRPQPGRIILRCKQVDEQAIIEVEDDGPGIEPSIRARLFEPFATSGSGSGLGLYVSRQIVEAFGGQIEVVDRQGGGTIVRVRLRAARR